MRSCWISLVVLGGTSNVELVVGQVN